MMIRINSQKILTGQTIDDKIKKKKKLFEEIKYVNLTRALTSINLIFAHFIYISNKSIINPEDPPPLRWQKPQVGP